MAGKHLKLTKGSVAKIAPVEGKQALVWDTDLRGFGIRVSPGGAKSYIMQRRVGRKERRVTIGRADVMSAEAARKKALALAAQFADGVDPIAERKRETARTMTLGDAFEAYILAPKKRGKGDTKKPSTIADIRKAMRRFNDWLDLPVTDISGAMVRDHHADMMRTSAAQANLAHRYLRAALNHINADSEEDEEPILRYNPVNRLNRLNQWADVERRTTYIPADRLAEWIDAVQSDLAGIKHDNECRDALMFLLLTGARIGEVLGDAKNGYPPLSWADVDLHSGVVTFRETKNGTDLRLPIGPQLLAMLEARKEISGEFVFSDGRDSAPKNLRSAIARIETKTDLHITAHDLRRTFISFAEIKLSLPTPLVMELTNHTKPKGDAHAGYVQFEDQDKQDAMAKIEAAMIGGAK